MGSKGFLSLLGVLAYCASARAETFAIDLSAARTVDPAATFEADCLGDSQADDCSVRAALLTTELVDLLGSLETSTDTDSVALFETAAQLPDPELQSIAMRYFASRGTVPDDIWTRARDFFFGPDPTVGQPAAELLERSSDTQDQMLSELYLEGRPSSTYGGTLPAMMGLTDTWALADVDDAILDAVGAFPADQQFTPATRLLMIDRFVPDAQGTGSEYPVTGFVTDASVAKVTAHFKDLFGVDPYGPLSSAQARSDALSSQLQTLTQQLAMGDTSGADKLASLTMELSQLQEAQSVGAALDLTALGGEDDVYWLDGKPNDVFLGPRPRAVSVGTQPLLHRTTIRYFGGAAAGTGTDAGVSQAHGDASTSDHPGTNHAGGDDAGGDVAGQPAAHGSGGGCALSARAEPLFAAWWSMLALAWLARSHRAPSTRPRARARLRASVS